MGLMLGIELRKDKKSRYKKLCTERKMTTESGGRKEREINKSEQEAETHKEAERDVGPKAVKVLNQIQQK